MVNPTSSTRITKPLVESSISISSPKRKRQGSVERMNPLQREAIFISSQNNNPALAISQRLATVDTIMDPRQLLLEFMELKQNQILTKMDTEIVDKILNGEMTSDQIKLYAKPVNKMKRVKITKRPVQYRGVGLSAIKQIKKSEKFRPEKKVKTEPTSDVAQTILDAIEQKETFGIGLLPNPYRMEMPVVNISPSNSPQMNENNISSSYGNNSVNNFTSHPTIFTPSKKSVETPIFTPSFEGISAEPMRQVQRINVTKQSLPPTNGFVTETSNVPTYVKIAEHDGKENCVSPVVDSVGINSLFNQNRKSDVSSTFSAIKGNGSTNMSDNRYNLIYKASLNGLLQISVIFQSY
jgi:hypothetical protein